MKELSETIATIIVSLLTAICTWWAWSEVCDLFPGLPPSWYHLSFMKCFFLGWLLRLVTNIVRLPTPVVDIKTKLKKV